MRIIEGVFATNEINRKGERFADSALEQSLEQLKKRGTAFLINHDWHRCQGWTNDGKLVREGNTLKLVGRSMIPETEDEFYYVKEQIKRLRQNILSEILDKARLQLTEVLGTFDEKQFILASGCNSLVFHEPGIVNRLVPNLFAFQDKDSLIPMSQIEFDLDTLTFRYQNIVLFPHKCFRRSMSRLNNFNREFLTYLYHLQQALDGANIRIRLDPDIISVSNAVGESGELDFWRGPKFNNDLRKIAEGVTVHKNSSTVEYYHGLDRTEFFWYSRDGQHIFEAEEIRKTPNLEDENAALPLYGQRYAHSIVDEDTGNILHLDGAVRIYNSFQHPKRVEVYLNKAKKDTRYEKLWRLDYPLKTNVWKSLIYLHYRNNETIAEYFGEAPNINDIGQFHSRNTSTSEEQKKYKKKKSKQ